VTKRTPSQITDPCLLEAGKGYTWAITSDNTITFGEYQNVVEYGTKHIALANLRPVYIAGEMLVDVDRFIKWNVASGSYTRFLINELSKNLNQTDNALALSILLDRTERVWAATSCPSRFLVNNFTVDNYFFSELDETIQPTNQAIQEICDTTKQSYCPVVYASGGCFCSNLSNFTTCFL